MKGYKVTDSKRSKTIGVACNSLSQLKAKGLEKLKLKGDVVVTLEDGTVVDDEHYFQLLPSQSVFVFYRDKEKIVTGVDLILNALRSVNATYLSTGEQVNRFLMQKTQELAELLEQSRGNHVGLSNTPDEDPDWFAGLETNAKTKDDYMFRKSQDRIRGYLYKFQEDARKHQAYLGGAECRKQLDECISFFKQQLSVDRFFGCYFDRRCSGKGSDHVDSMSKRKLWIEEEPAVKKIKNEESVDGPPKVRNCKGVGPRYDKSSYCDEAGTFLCQGRWQLKCCEYSAQHLINPYSNRESRILFSTWNLDHRIEKSRTILPTLLKAIESRPVEKHVNFTYFYQLLFTNYNLKLVHVVCHDKACHDVVCDSRYLYST